MDVISNMILVAYLGAAAFFVKILPKMTARIWNYNGEFRLIERDIQILTKIQKHAGDGSLENLLEIQEKFIPVIKRLKGRYIDSHPLLYYDDVSLEVRRKYDIRLSVFR